MRRSRAGATRRGKRATSFLRDERKSCAVSGWLGLSRRVTTKTILMKAPMGMVRVRVGKKRKSTTREISLQWKANKTLEAHKNSTCPIYFKKTRSSMAATIVPPTMLWATRVEIRSIWWTVCHTRLARSSPYSTPRAMRVKFQLLFIQD